MTSPSRRHVALLRGINVGGARRLPMAELRALFADAGARAVETYIQSGNVVFDVDAAGDGAAAGRRRQAEAARVAARVADALAERFDGPVPVVLRGAEELDAAVDAMPFDVDAGEPKHFHVGFLEDAPSAAAADAADPDPFPPDRWRLRGREVYAHYPHGSARSKLTVAWLEKALGTRCTMRNWNTVLRLQAMTRR